MRLIKFFILFLCIYSNSFAQKQYFLSINGDSKYKNDFKHFEYVNPNAPKGGTYKASAIGTFDSLNPFILKGHSATGIGMVYDTLMTSSQDEPFVMYPLIAQAVEVSEKNDWIKFYINPKAKFQDGKPITAYDVKFSFDILTSKANPAYKRYYFDVKEAVVLDKHTVKFNFKRNDNKELPLILGQLAVLPKHFWEGKNFLKSDSIQPIGSGAYKLDKYKFSKYISFKLDENYWAKNLNVNVGQNNFEKVQYDYYKDTTVAFEAFKAGQFDFTLENVAKNWATSYTGKNFDNGNIIKKTIPHELAAGMQGFVFNTRKELFKDINIRKALNLAFDFEWTNKKLFYGQYKRLNSYFANCDLEAKGLPSKEELKLLEPFKSELPKEVFGTAFKSNVTKGDGNIRAELRTALRILKKAGWNFEDKVLVKDGKKFEFEILVSSNAMQRLLLPYARNLKKIGVIANIRLLDQVAYMNRLNNFDYDMVVISFGGVLSPGNEQRNNWGSKAAHLEGSRNYIGIESKAVDSLIDNIVSAKNRKELRTATKALDRVLTHSYFVVPNWYLSSYRVAYWNKFEQPKISPKYSFGLFTWWVKEEFRK